VCWFRRIGIRQPVASSRLPPLYLLLHTSLSTVKLLPSLSESAFMIYGMLLPQCTVAYIYAFQTMFVFCWKETHALIFALFCDFTQRGMVIPYRRCGTTYCSYLQGTAWPVKMGPMGHPEPSVRNFHSKLPKSEKGADFICSWAEAWNHVRSCLLCFFESLTLLLLVICVFGESNGKLPLRSCPGCSVPELYQSTDWALVSAQTGPRAEYQ